MELIPLLVGLAAVGLAMGVHFRGVSRSEAAWRLAAERLGLQFRPSKLLDSSRIFGKLRGFEVTVESITDGKANDSGSYTRVVVEGDQTIPKSITLASETFWTALDLLGDKIEIGDRSFDEVVMVRGPQSILLAALDQETRGLVAAFVSQDRGCVRDGRIVSETPRMADSTLLELRVVRMVAIAERLSIRRHEVNARIANNVVSETDPNVRLRFLRNLRAKARDAEACERAARAALDDSSPPVRLLAAELLGADGVGVLRELVANDHVSNQVRGDALSLLGRLLPEPRLLPVVGTFLREAFGPLAVVALRVAKERGLKSVLGSVVELTQARSLAVVAAATRALGAIGDASSVVSLVRLLDHEEHEIKVAACESLGQVGTVDAVGPLLSYTEGIFRSGDLKRAARNAVRQIQSRLSGAEAGRLSVAEADPRGSIALTRHPLPNRGILSSVESSPELERLKPKSPTEACSGRKGRTGRKK